MAVVFICGFETGDALQCDGSGVSGTASIQTTIKRTGGYALRVNPTTSAIGFVTIATIGFPNEFAMRFYFYVTTLPAGGSTREEVMRLGNSGTIGLLYLNNTGTLDYTVGGVSKGVSAALATGQWYRIDIKWITGAQEISLNGVQFATDTQAATATAPNFGKTGNTSSQTIDVYYDDIILTNASAAYPIGEGRSIARQPGAGLGTPTYNAWTKSTGTDAGALWDNTPFTTGDFNSTATQNAQTSFISPFSAGVNPIGPNDVINACQVGLVAKTSATSSNGTNLNIRRRVAAADTDVLVALTTSDAYYAETTLWTATLAELDAMQAGAVTTLSTRTRTVEDVWVFCDYREVLISRPRPPTLGALLAQ